MSAIDRVRRTRIALAATIAATAVLWAGAAGSCVIVASAFIDSVNPLSLNARRAVIPVSMVAAIAALALVVWRGRQVWSLSRVALFIEERVATLEFALVTAIDVQSPPAHELLESIVDRADYRGALRTPVAKAIGAPMLVLAVLSLAFAAMPGGSRDRVLSPHTGDALLSGRQSSATASQLTPIVVRITPPRYTRLPPQVLEDPFTVPAPIGSSVEVLGRGVADLSSGGFTAEMENALAVPVEHGDTWSVVVTMPVHPSVLRLANRGGDRLLTLEPIPDLEPRVTLLAPARDTTLTNPPVHGRLALAAQATDDYGIAEAKFEILHTTGSGEQYKTKRTFTDLTMLGGSRTARLHGELQFDSLALGPGDVLNVRAIATDQNDVSGPGQGSSETRTIRISDPRERDTVRVDAGPAIVIDTTSVSERMLITSAEALLRRHLARGGGGASLEAQSRRIAEDQGRLRARVDAVTSDLDVVTEAGSFGPTSASPLLHRASSAMVDAEGALNAAQVRSALPHMYRALALLDSARTSNRLYLRGTIPRVVVDVGAIRLTGTDSDFYGSRIGSRIPRTELVDLRASLVARIDRVTSLIPLSPRAALDSLTMIRLDALREAPEVADLLARAIEEMRSGSGADPAPELLAVRRRLETAAVATPRLSPWSGMAAP
jgi:hypothetical protein